MAFTLYFFDIVYPPAVLYSPFAFFNCIPVCSYVVPVTFSATVVQALPLYSSIKYFVPAGFEFAFQLNVICCPCAVFPPVAVKFVATFANVTAVTSSDSCSLLALSVTIVLILYVVFGTKSVKVLLACHVPHVSPVFNAYFVFVVSTPLSSSV